MLIHSALSHNAPTLSERLQKSPKLTQACLAVEVQPADYSTAAVQRPQNFYYLAVRVSEGQCKCGCLMPGVDDQPP